jgi:hypothetical protein
LIDPRDGTMPFLIEIHFSSIADDLRTQRN